MTFEDFLSRLEGVRSAPGGYLACCPAHEDRHPSLSVTGAHDRTLIFCQSRKCDWRDIVDAMGLKPSDLWYGTWAPDLEPQQPLDWWHYADEQGNYLYSVVKFAKREGGKRFAQYHIRDGQTVWNLKDVRKVPYLLPLLVAAPRGSTVYILEGEKDVQRAQRDGKIATTFPGGAKSILPTYIKFFRDLKVIIVRDKDEAGHEHAELVKESLEGIAEEVWVVEALEGNDYSDHRDAGHPVERLVIV